MAEETDVPIFSLKRHLIFVVINN